MTSLLSTMRPASSALTARLACEICRERKVRCDRALPKCRRCDRLNQECNYNQLVQRRTRDEQLQQLQERLAKTEAQLALTAPREPPCVQLQSQPETAEVVVSSQPLNTPDPYISSTNSPRSSQYQQPTSSYAQILPISTQSTSNTTGIELENSGNTSFYNGIDMATDSLSLLEPELFESFNMGSGPGAILDCTNQSLTALEPLDNLLFKRTSPQSICFSITKDDISSAELSTLHTNYFETVYFSFPFINRDRFTVESSGSVGPAMNALIHAVALAGCSHSSEDANRQSACYNLARGYAETCERDGILNDINFLQALLLIGRFEAMSRKLERSWLTLGRVAMLCSLLELAHIDQPEELDSAQDNRLTDDSILILPVTKDPILLEERRRTFWALYILESYLKTRTGWPCRLGDVKNFQVNLPMPGHLRSDLTPLSMPLLTNLHAGPIPEISSYAGCVMMVELALECFEHGQERASGGFWDGYYRLVKKTDELFSILNEHLNAKSVREDPVAFSLYLNLRATEIHLHELAITRSEDQGVPQLMTAEGQRRATAAAFQISSAVGLNLPSPLKVNSDIIMLQAMFIAWPLTMALKAFHRELMSSGRRETTNGVGASLRMLFAALDHIEESGGHWHRCVAHIKLTLQEWDEKNSFNPLALYRR